MSDTTTEFGGGLGVKPLDSRGVRPLGTDVQATPATQPSITVEKRTPQPDKAGNIPLTLKRRKHNLPPSPPEADSRWPSTEHDNVITGEERTYQPRHGADLHEQHDNVITGMRPEVHFEDHGSTIAAGQETIPAAAEPAIHPPLENEEMRPAPQMDTPTETVTTAPRASGWRRVLGSLFPSRKR